MHTKLERKAYLVRLVNTPSHQSGNLDGTNQYWNDGSLSSHCLNHGLFEVEAVKQSRVMDHLSQTAWLVALLNVFKSEAR